MKVLADNIQSFVDAGVDESVYPESAFKVLFRVQRKHFWFVGRNAIILDFVRRYRPVNGPCRLLEVGCGSGSVLKYLADHGVDAEGADLFLSALKFCRRCVATPLYQIDALNIPFENQYDMIGIFDCLEHIPDDEAVLQQLRKALKPGGILLITVPAYRWLWSYFDELSHHQRRYERRELLQKLERGGFQVKRLMPFMCCLLPLVLLTRKSGALRKAKPGCVELDTLTELKIVPGLNGLLTLLLHLEKYIIRLMNLPFGSSLLAVAAKPVGDTAPYEN